jgi:hypothetical protein
MWISNFVLINVSFVRMPVIRTSTFGTDTYGSFGRSQLQFLRSLNGNYGPEAPVAIGSISEFETSNRSMTFSL